MASVERSEYKMEEKYIPNPRFPYTYFPASLHDGTVGVIGIYKRFNVPTPDKYKTADEIKAELHLDYLEVNSACGKWLVSIRKENLSSVYDIAQGFVNKQFGVCMNDLTCANFHTGEQVTYENHQLKILEMCQRPYSMLKKYLPIHRDAFWTLPEGKAWAKKYREETGDLDKRGDKEYFVAEYLEEVIKMKKAT